MPASDPSIEWVTYAAALAVILAVSFLVPYLATDRGRVPRAWYVALLTLATGAMTWAYLWVSGTDPAEFLFSGWGWGLLGAAVSGAITGRQASRWPARGRSPGESIVGRVLWEGLVYGATEATLLSILPVLTVWQGGRSLGWTDGWTGVVGVGALAMAASVAVIAIHHLGYREFRGKVLRYPIMACGVFSLAYLLTGSVIAAIGGHVVLHVVMIVRGSELPPHRATTEGFDLPDAARIAPMTVGAGRTNVRG